MEEPKDLPEDFKAMLGKLSDAEKMEALASFAAAQRAEERAALRALEKKKAEERSKIATVKAAANGNNASGKIQFVSKKRRRQMQEEAKAAEAAKPKTAARTSTTTTKGNKPPPLPPQQYRQQQQHLNNMQLVQLRHQYVGKTQTEIEDEQSRKMEKQRRDKRRQFKFQWDADEDTSRDADPLYDATSFRLFKSRERDPLLEPQKGSKGGQGMQARHTVYTKPLGEMTTRDWRIIREDFDIRVRGGRAPNPLRSFRESEPPIHKDILYAIDEVLKYKDPSPIQRQAIPIGLLRRDMIGIAETGSGKTAAFGIPMVNYILNMPDDVLGSVAQDGPLAIVMAPTRELALQIDEEMQKLLSGQSFVQTLAIVGGQDVETQAFKLRNGVHIIVGTPGRMQDMLDSAYLVLNQCSYIVLDEADRMLHMGFEPQMTAILEAMSGKMKSSDEEEAYKQEEAEISAGTMRGVPEFRLTAMFSATMPAEVERLARSFLRHPAIISVGDQGSGKNKRILQRTMYLAGDKQKERELETFTKSIGNSDKVIVFVNERKTADKVARGVERAGRRTVVLHGGKAQALREENLATFKQGGYVLIATDVAGRGIDVDNVTHVLNYDMPSKIDNYCHRIGRTGRAGKSGTAINFLTDKDEEVMPDLLKYLKDTNAEIPVKLARQKGGGDDDFFK